MSMLAPSYPALRLSYLKMNQQSVMHFTEVKTPFYVCLYSFHVLTFSDVPKFFLAFFIRKTLAQNNILAIFYIACYVI